MKRTLLFTVFICILVLTVPARGDSGDEGLQEAIDYLVEFVRNSDVVFIRNDKEHTPEDAASHMLKKYKYAKGKVKTPEDFIEYCATKSTMSGKPYRVRLKDGSTITSAEWLLAALEDYRKGGPAYEMKEFRKQYGTCPTLQEDCASVRIIYPEFTGAPEDTALAAIAGEIRRRLTAPLYEDTEPMTYDELADTFIEGYRNTQTDFPDYELGWTLEREVTVVYADDSIICFAFEEMSFTGGAHPNSRKAFFSYRLSDGSAVGLSEILVEGYEEELTRAAEKVFRQVRGLMKDESLQEAGFWFEDGVFSLNDNFGVTASGLVFYFDYYEVAPYAMGPTEITVSYDAIASLIRKGEIMKGAVR